MCSAASARGSWSNRSRTKRSPAASRAARSSSRAIARRPSIAALAAHGGEVTVRGAAELRVKESDRIAALVAGFRAIGHEADERPDGFTIRAARSPRGGGVADARGDHRMAMAFAIAALSAER